MNLTTDRLVHRGRPRHKMEHNFIYLACMPHSYLAREDYVPLFDEPITCLECLVAVLSCGPADHGWRRA